HGLGDAVEDRHAVHVLAPAPGRHAGHHLGAVGQHLLGVEAAVAAGDPLHDQARVAVDQDAHAATSCALAITVRTPSSIDMVAARPFSERIFRASSSLVPVRRMTRGTCSGELSSDCTMPRATSSQRVMPPKMLNRIARTCESPVMILSAAVTLSGFEDP